jgi:hypothetical protein
LIIVLEHPIPMVDRGVFGAEPRTEHGMKIRRHKVVVEQMQDLREYVRDSAGNVSQGAWRRRRSQPRLGTLLNTILGVGLVLDELSSNERW